MQLQTSSKELTKALKMLAYVIPKKSYKPILQNAMLDVGDRATLSATNLDTYITVTLEDCNASEKGRCLIPSTQTANIAKRAKSDTVTIATENSGKITVNNGGANYQLRSDEIQDFPMIPVMPPLCATIGGKEMARLLDQTLFATAKQATKYAVNSTFLEVGNGTIRCVATDGKRLSVAESNGCETSCDAQSTLVPIPLISLVRRLLTPKSTVEIAFKGTTCVFFRVDNVTMSAPVVEGHFPKYQTIIPTNYEYGFQIQTEAMLSALKDLTLVCDDENKGILFTFEGEDHVKLQAGADEAPSGTATCRLQVKWITSKHIETPFAANAQYLTEAVSAIDSAEFQLNHQPGKIGGMAFPIQLTCSGYMHILMPLNLESRDDKE